VIDDVSVNPITTDVPGTIPTNTTISVVTSSVPTNTTISNPGNETVQTKSLTPVNTTDTNFKSVKEESNQLKAGLNNTSETELTTFNSYVNLDAIVLKNRAQEKIKAALSEDQVISGQLDNISQLAPSNTTGESLTQNTITDLITDAEKLNDEAAELRKSSVTKSADEKEKDINNARLLESNAISKKIEAANKQQQLNKAT